MRYRLRTLLILLAIVPPMLAGMLWAGFMLWQTYLWFFPPPGGWSGGPAGTIP